MLVESTNQVCIKSVHSIPYTSRRTCMQPVSWKTKIPTVAGVGRPYRLYPKAIVRLRISERKRFFRVIRFGNAAISNARISTRIRCGNLAHVGDNCK